MKSFFCKRIVVLLLCCQFFFISCKTGSQSADKTTIASIDSNDAIINKFKHFFKDSFPKPENYLSDYENIFTTVEEDSLNRLIHSYQKQTSNEIAVVSLDTAMVSKQNFDALTLQLARKWGIGQKEKNNGILIGICAGYRKMRIQNGTGIEKVLPDSVTKTIIDSSFIPYFKQADYFTGTVTGINAIIQHLNKVKL
jgi:uncharacterized protein